MSEGRSAVHHFGVLQLCVFLAALGGGTLCSLTSKGLYNSQAMNLDGKMQYFSFPLFQTFAMFIGMLFAIVMHWLVVAFRIPYPGYETWFGPSDAKDIEAGVTYGSCGKNISFKTYMLIIVPSVFDLGATALCMAGLQFVDASVYQLMRGSAIICVTFLKVVVLKTRMKGYHFVGVFWNICSITLVGITAYLIATTGGGGVQSGGKNPLLGVLLVFAGAFVQSLQYVFEEVFMTGEMAEADSIPSLLLIGMEGFWGTLLCIFVLYPAAYYFKGNDVGGVYENPWNTVEMIKNSTQVQWIALAYCTSIFIYNICSVLMVFLLDSVWRAILDNFRPMSVWGFNMLIFYHISPGFGEPWNHKYSWIQLLGMAILLYGTAIYNAPNVGSIKLKGDLISCGIDMSRDYEAVAAEKQAPPPSPSFDHTAVVSMGVKMSPSEYTPRTRKAHDAALEIRGINRRNTGDKTYGAVPNK